MGRRTTAGPVAFLAVGVLWLGLSVGVRAHDRARPARPCRARPNCPMFPADNVWNTPDRGPAGRPAQRGLDGQHGRRAPPTSIPTSGRRATPPTPTACPTPWCRPSQPAGARHVPVRRRERSRAVPVQRRARRLRAASSPPATATPSWSTRPRAPSTSSTTRATARRARPPARAPSGTSTPTPCARPAGRRPTRPACRSCPGLAPLRRGAVGRHHPRHPHDGRGDGHLVPVAGPPRGGDVVQPEPAADGGPLPAEGRATTSRATRRRPRSSCAPCSSTA